MASDVKSKVLTVLGPESPDKLGVVLPHEHLLLDFRKAEIRPQYLPQDAIRDLSLEMNNLGKIRQYPYSVAMNLVIDNEDEIVDELKLFKQAGGGTLCDLTVTGIRIKANTLKKISMSTGVHIVCGTGFYVDSFLTEDIKKMRNEELTQFMVDEIVNGIQGSDGVRCGIIGEIGCSWPLTVYEKRSLQAAAIAQRETGAPLIIHPGRSKAAPFEIVDILREAGADISRTVMSHLDRTFSTPDEFLKFAETGCYSELDVFGIECSQYQFKPEVDMMSDAQRMEIVKFLCMKGHSDHVLISHDIHTKHRLVKYGGHGYSHISENIIPRMKDRGIPSDMVEKITTVNPKTWLTFQ